MKDRGLDSGIEDLPFVIVVGGSGSGANGIGMEWN